ncbi:MAG TPA: AAC(3) family N-acetyltransferase [Azospirillaceae bacterium]|nr:AAC(3) family N-acetyltransferase [Azospirillaceae bacterium]
MSVREVIAGTPGPPVTADGLAEDLAALGVRRGSVLLAHVSLSALGWVCGGPVAVLEALGRVLGPDGTLVMPAFSGDLSDPATWVSPAMPPEWWPTIQAAMPPYDPDTTPTWGMGTVAELFRRWPGAVRSRHPQLSFAAHGPRADEIVADHTLDDAFGEGTPLARLYDLDARVLLLGVGHERNSSLHLAEQRASWPSKRRIIEGGPILRGGRRIWATWGDLDYRIDDFPTLGQAFEQWTGMVAVGPAGYGTARLMRQRDLVDFAVGWMAANRV